MGGGKTLIGGTAYSIKNGKTLIGGTSYKITGGKTLINSTSYNISFWNPYWIYNEGYVSPYTQYYWGGHSGTSSGMGPYINQSVTRYQETYTCIGVYTDSGRSQFFGTVAQINFTPYKYLKIVWCINGGGTASSGTQGNTVILGTGYTGNMQNKGSWIYYPGFTSNSTLTDINGVTYHRNYAFQEDTFDITSITGSYHIIIHQNESLTSKPSTDTYVAKIWLE